MILVADPTFLHDQLTKVARKNSQTYAWCSRAPSYYQIILVPSNGPSCNSVITVSQQVQVVIASNSVFKKIWAYGTTTPNATPCTTTITIH